jgi:hypothetical protein
MDPPAGSAAPSKSMPGPSGSASANGHTP